MQIVARPPHLGWGPHPGQQRKPGLAPRGIFNRVEMCTLHILSFLQFEAQSPNQNKMFLFVAKTSKISQVQTPLQNSLPKQELDSIDIKWFTWPLQCVLKPYTSKGHIGWARSVPQADRCPVRSEVRGRFSGIREIRVQSSSAFWDAASRIHSRLRWHVAPFPEADKAGRSSHCCFMRVTKTCFTLSRGTHIHKHVIFFPPQKHI